MPNTESVYVCLREKISVLESDPRMTMGSMMDVLCKDEAINWKMIKTQEKTLPTWEKIATNWKYWVIRRFTKAGRFVNGGDRVSAMYKGKKQQHIVEYVEQQTKATDQCTDTEALVDRCILEVKQKWQTNTTEGYAVINRVVRHTVLRTRGIAIDDTNCTVTDSMFEKLEITEVRHDVPQDIGGVPFAKLLALDSQVLGQLFDYQKHVLTCQSRNIEAEARKQKAIAQQKEFDTEAERLRERANLLEVQHRIGNVSRKRATTVIADEARLETQIAMPWNNMQSVTGPVWDARPSNHTGTLAEFMTVFKTWASSNLVNMHSRLRMVPKHRGAVVVYCDAAVDIDKDIIPKYWGGPSVTATILPPAVTTAPPHRKPRSLPDGVFDLAAVVLQPLGMQEGTAEYDNAMEKMDLQFCRPTATVWGILWPKRPNGKCIPTRMDVQRDPIIEELREWVRTGFHEPVPSYPAMHTLDVRPAEIVPPELATTSPDVWPFLQRAGLERACGKRLAAYQRSHGLPIPAAQQPHDERLRQFQRITSNSEEVPYKTIAECLGWHNILNDTLAVKCITEALMLQPNRSGGPVQLNVWYMKRGDHAYWRWRMVLHEMRMAAIFITRLRLGGDNLDFLARDVLQCCCNRQPVL